MKYSSLTQVAVAFRLLATIILSRYPTFPMQQIGMHKTMMKPLGQYANTTCSIFCLRHETIGHISLT